MTSGARSFFNRLIFRSMLFGCALIAIGMYRFSSDETAAWRFAKARARTLARLLGVRVHVSGLEHLERFGDGPFVYTPNHQSHFDIAALLGYLPGITCVATKKELFAEPVLGLVLKTMGLIPVDRDDPAAASELLEGVKANRQSTVIFPEGTRSRDGRLLPFKKGAFVAAIDLQIPVVPVVCTGGASVMPKGKYLSIEPGDVELRILEPISTEGMTYEDRGALLATVRERIASELGEERCANLPGRSDSAAA
ncbi:MAG: 1-acyl-sn-glycerol-3-phosphate acyltransferase [Myxococcales bacterium]|nr:MAG: 1-acyl-sn-glycerol-3-phosphate acyltransferase [Myxococcales bacterium]